MNQKYDRLFAKAGFEQRSQEVDIYGLNQYAKNSTDKFGKSSEIEASTQEEFIYCSISYVFRHRNLRIHN